MINARLRPETTVEALDDGVRRITAATSDVLEMVADADEQELWRRDGATSMTPWLAARYGLAWGTAREWVRVAHALRRLPAIAEAYAASRMSWDQVRPVTRFATPESDEFWAGRAGHLRPRSLYREAERHRVVRPLDAEQVRRLRHLSMEWNLETTMLHLEGALPPEEGAAVQTALLKRSETIQGDGREEDRTADARMADALVELVTGGPGEPSPATLVVHAGAEVLTGEAPERGPTLAETEGGQRLATDQVRRLACDARIEWQLERGGRPVGIGRRGRTVTGPMLRVLRHRDQHCRFPGCEHLRWLKAHHLVHWADGGSTDLENLILVCQDHHRLLHEGGWRVSGRAGGELRFHDPTGRPLRTAPLGARAPDLADDAPG